MKQPMSRARALAILTELGFKLKARTSGERFTGKEKLPDVESITDRVYHWVLYRAGDPFCIHHIFTLDDFQYWSIEDENANALLQSRLAERIIEKVSGSKYCDLEY